MGNGEWGTRGTRETRETRGTRETRETISFYYLLPITYYQCPISSILQWQKNR
ncbi:MAG: hypothetical protein KME31_18195 [Tolypothrix carrinoi HA7290-LM1]|nr:hypothetical protein [Tolypothrix carrinoi HA7290-LM1]